MTCARRQRAWSAANPGNQAIREELAATLLYETAPVLSGTGDLLDAGCGTGWWLALLADDTVAPQRLHGVDIDPARAEAARRRAPGANVIEADLRELPYPDGRFDAVFLLTVLSSAGGREPAGRAVAETWRVLAPGGLLVIWEPRVPNPLNRATTLIRPPDVAWVAGEPASSSTLTLLPWLARRLGARTPTWYPRLAQLPFLRTHRLSVWER